MAPRKTETALDHAAVIEQLKAMLPKDVVIEHHVTVRVVFDYVTRHPVSGEDVPIQPQVRRIANQT